jgi:GT2 family glycosyltransferase
MSVERHTPRVSVIIPTWNRSAELRTCLQALDLQDFAAKEVIVADDCSTDGTCQMVENEFPRVRLIRGTERLGPSARRNEAISLAQGEFLLFLDSDITFPTPAVVSNMVRRMDSFPSIGAIGGEMAAFAGEKDVAYGKRWTRSLYAVRVSATGDEVVPCDYLATCNCMVRREAVQKIGGFDEDMSLLHGEDMDFGLRLTHAGYGCRVCWDCSAYHHASSSGRSEQESLDYCRCRARILLKHYGVLRTIAQFFWDTIVGVWRLICMSIGTLFQVSGARTRLSAKYAGLVLVWRGYGALLGRKDHRPETMDHRQQTTDSRPQHGL